MNQELPLLKLKPDDFQHGLKVVNRTKRFIIFVPALLHGGEALVFPPQSRYAGRQIKQGRGVVFYNGVDSAWQAAQGNGEDCIIINDITAPQAALLLEKYKALLGQNKNLNLQSIKTLLSYARQELNIVDFYNKRASSVLRDTKPIDESNPFFMEVNKEEIHKALYIPQGFTFDGPVQQVYPQGAIMVSTRKRCWGVGTEVFLRGYRKIENGKEYSLTSIENDFGKKFTFAKA
ncbi:hypothetical protein QSV37_09720 [Acinetobacter sp. VNK23]|uniref:hypothetical protein n=1 Tax=Acinetobacter thutiue TaxID=2998078 RepID=UPI002576BE39|nr:hypothetical protein [Acinetobacter thutiue]MDM1020572.1 hypothetical protein [Acinetobacter thutiue]